MSTVQLNSDLEIRPIIKIFNLTPTTNPSGVFIVNDDFSMFTKAPIAIWNLRNDLNYPYDIFVYGKTDTTMEFRVRNTSDNSAVANKTLPKVMVYIIGI